MNESWNIATDMLIEIDGVNMAYPAVELADETAARLILVYDYTEAGNIYQWVEQTIEIGSFNDGKRIISVVTEDVAGTEISRRNYFGCFPIGWEQFGGFRQFIQLKERIVIECDSREPA